MSEEPRAKFLVAAKQLRTQTELRSFLGLVNVYRRFVQNFSDVAAALNALLRKVQPSKR